MNKVKHILEELVSKTKHKSINKLLDDINNDFSYEAINKYNFNKALNLKGRMIQPEWWNFLSNKLDIDDQFKNNLKNIHEFDIQFEKVIIEKKRNMSLIKKNYVPILDWNDTCRNDLEGSRENDFNKMFNSRILLKRKLDRLGFSTEIINQMLYVKWFRKIDFLIHISASDLNFFHFEPESILEIKQKERYELESVMDSLSETGKGFYDAYENSCIYWVWEKEYGYTFAKIASLEGVNNPINPNIYCAYPYGFYNKNIYLKSTTDVLGEVQGVYKCLS